MKIVFALALGLGVSLPLAAPVSAQTRSTAASLRAIQRQKLAAARVLRRQKLASWFPQLSIQPDIVPTKVGRPRNIAPSRTTAAVTPRASNKLEFSIIGFNSTQTQELRTFLSKNYDLIVKIWGEPQLEQQGKTLKIVNYDTDPLTGTEDEYLPQFYYPPATVNSQGERIEFSYKGDATATDYNQFQLLKLVLNAFQGPRVPAFNFAEGQYVEPYLFGASEAAALQIIYQAQGSPTTFSPSRYALYLLPYYDAFDSPALGNPFIYPASGEDLILSDFRLSMSQAAFLKLYTEKETFFKDFNKALYNRGGAARSSISTDALETIGASVTPTVEGLPYRSWIREQGSLNARVTTGSKIYLAAYAPPAQATGDTRPVAGVFAEAFSTDSAGQDSALYPGASRDKDNALLPVYGTLDAFDETGRNINSYSDELTTNRDDLGILAFDAPSSPGDARTAIAFRPFGSPLAARIKIRARLNSTEATVFVPLAAAGTTSAPATYYGAMLAGTSGRLQITAGTKSQDLIISRGVFSATTALPTVSGPRVQTTFSDGTRTFKRNTAWLAPATKDTFSLLEFRLNGGGASASSTLNLSASNGRLKMIAFPLRPDERDEARALGYKLDLGEKLDLARFRPDLSPATTKDGGLVFGIGGSKYELYPNISQGPEAGRGYWIKVPASGLTRQVAGVFPPTNQSVEVELKSGWNQIGVPRSTSVGALNVKVRYGGYTPVSLQEAQARGWIATGVWRYNGSSGYQRVDVSGGNLAPWEGYWVFASPGSGTSLVFDPTTSTTAVRALSSPNGSWSLGIAAGSSTSRDESASFGVSTQKAASKPPVATQQLSVYFPPTDTASSSGGGSAQSFLKKLAAKNEWKFTLDGATKGERVTLYWPGFKNVPSGLQLQLRDEATKKIVTTMKSGSKWSFTSDGKAHQFTVVGTPTTDASSTKTS